MLMAAGPSGHRAQPGADRGGVPDPARWRAGVSRHQGPLARQRRAGDRHLRHLPRHHGLQAGRGRLAGAGGAVSRPGGAIPRRHLHHPAGRLCYINPCFARLFGYDTPGALLAVGHPARPCRSQGQRPGSPSWCTRASRTRAISTPASVPCISTGRSLEVELYGRRVDYLGQPAIIGHSCSMSPSGSRSNRP
jgi:hypothetical protein